MSSTSSTCPPPHTTAPSRPSPHDVVSAHLCPALGPALRPATAGFGNTRIHTRARANAHERADKEKKERALQAGKRKQATKRRSRATDRKCRGGEQEAGGAAAAGAHRGGACRTVLRRAKLQLLSPAPLPLSLFTVSRVLRSSSGGCDGASCGCARAVTRRDPCSGLETCSRGRRSVLSVGGSAEEEKEAA